MWICEKGGHCIDPCDERCGHYIEVEPVRRGHWLNTGYYGKSKNPVFMCSECRRSVEDYFIKSHKFCLHCGARMDGE